jgi:hypothetical protein
MATKQNFKPEEWTKILESTMLAGMAVSAAEPSGLWGALKEAFASSSALVAAKANAGSNDLVKAVVADFGTKEGRAAVQEALRKHLAGATKPADTVQRSLDNLRGCLPRLYRQHRSLADIWRCRFIRQSARLPQCPLSAINGLLRGRQGLRPGRGRGGLRLLARALDQLTVVFAHSLATLRARRVDRVAF